MTADEILKLIEKTNDMELKQALTLALEYVKLKKGLEFVLNNKETLVEEQIFSWGTRRKLKNEINLIRELIKHMK